MLTNLSSQLHEDISVNQITSIKVLIWCITQKKVPTDVWLSALLLRVTNHATQEGINNLTKVTQLSGDSTSGPPGSMFCILSIMLHCLRSCWKWNRLGSGVKQRTPTCKVFG